MLINKKNVKYNSSLACDTDIYDQMIKRGSCVKLHESDSLPIAENAVCRELVMHCCYSYTYLISGSGLKKIKRW